MHHSSMQLILLNVTLNHAQMMFQAIGKPPKFVYVPTWIFDLSIDMIASIAKKFPSQKWEDALETAKIGKYCKSRHLSSIHERCIRYSSFTSIISSLQIIIGRCCWRYADDRATWKVWHHDHDESFREDRQRRTRSLYSCVSPHIFISWWFRLYQIFQYTTQIPFQLMLVLVLWIPFATVGSRATAVISKTLEALPAISISLPVGFGLLTKPEVMDTVVASSPLSNVPLLIAQLNDNIFS